MEIIIFAVGKKSISYKYDSKLPMLLVCIDTACIFVLYGFAQITDFKILLMKILIGAFKISVKNQDLYPPPPSTSRLALFLQYPLQL